MRASSQNYGVIDIDGVIVGVALGADYCAEHEWGFEWKSRLGIPDQMTKKLCGFPGRTNTKNQLYTHLFEHKKELWLVCTIYSHDLPEDFVERRETKHVAYDYGLPWNPDNKTLKDLRTAWDGTCGFCIVGQTDRGKEAVRVVHNALQNNHLAIGYGSSANPFSRPGLNLLDITKLPQEVLDAARVADFDHIHLTEAVEKTGIKTRLKAAKKTYYALSPQWDDEAPEGVKFFLNPTEQDRNNFGWFTVKDLDDWIAGRGSIPMTDEQRPRGAD